MKMRRPDRRTQQSGFTLLEMLISLALILVLSGSILGGMGDMQKTYRHNEIRSVLNGQMRAVLEMMAQEVGQAGLPASGMAGNTIYTGSGAAGAAAKVGTRELFAAVFLVGFFFFAAVAGGAAWVGSGWALGAE